VARGELAVDVFPGGKDVVEHHPERLARGGEPSGLSAHPATDGAQDRLEELDDVGRSDEARPADLVGVVSGALHWRTEFSVGRGPRSSLAGGFFLGVFICDLCDAHSRAALGRVFLRVPV
jgi:hypothetical protein